MHVRGPAGGVALARMRRRPTLLPDVLTSATSTVAEDLLCEGPRHA